jgi:hypothetical protein
VAWAYPRHSSARRRVESRLWPAASRAEGVGRIALRLEPARRRADVDALLRTLVGAPAEEPIVERAERSAPLAA